jgi:hypothetical protein
MFQWFDSRPALATAIREARHPRESAHGTHCARLRLAAPAPRVPGRAGAPCFRNARVSAMTRPASPVHVGAPILRQDSLDEQPDTARQSLIHKEILVLGDSHAAVFSDARLRAEFPLHSFNVVAVGGATASGLENPNSKTQSSPIFLEAVKKSAAATVLVLLGEVDTGFVIWYRAEKYKAEVSEMLLTALTSYQSFLTLLRDQRRVICLSAPLPTITDGQEWGAVANARRDVRASQLERTMLTIGFNESMRKFCESNGIEYLDFDDESIGKEGLVDSKLLNSNPLDHHYEPRAYLKMMIPKLRSRL